MKALIDADIVVYEAGNAADYRYYTVDNIQFTTMKEARAYVQDTYRVVNKKDQNPFITFHRDPTPVQYSLSNCKELIGRIMERTGSTKGQLYLTSDDKSNYRFGRATLRPYKGNRKPDTKPCRYHEMREYLVNSWGAEMISGREADDALGCAQTENERVYHTMLLEGQQEGCYRTVLCSKDKDLKMIPGLRFDWQRDEMYEITMEEADAWFYYQLIAGDSTDHIQGVPGTGDVGATEALAGIDTNRGRYETAFELYRRACEKAGEDTAEDAVLSRLRENADLLWIQREEGVMWEVPSNG